MLQNLSPTFGKSGYCYNSKVRRCFQRAARSLANGKGHGGINQRNSSHLARVDGNVVARFFKARASRQQMQRRSNLVFAGLAELETPVMVNDCSGKMGHAVAEAVVEAGLTLVPFAFTGSTEGGTVACGGIAVQCITPDQNWDEKIEELKGQYPGMIVVDYTIPTAVNSNAAFYAKHGVPFVMGTTGGDREALVSATEESQVHAVIAPQMGKQVVAFQAAMELMAKEFPGAFAGYKLQVVESHQSSKVDTSGTAKALVESFNKLGANFDVKDIEKVRAPSESVSRMGVPDEHLLGHAYHTYHLTSPDGLVNFEFQHNVCSRSIYAQGTVDAVVFLASKIKEGSTKYVHNMIDVLREGNMRD